MSNFLYSVNISFDDAKIGYSYEYHLIVEAYSIKGLNRVVENYIHDCGFKKSDCEVTYGLLTVTEEDNIITRFTTKTEL